MAKIEAAKLKRENELLRRELEALRASQSQKSNLTNPSQLQQTDKPKVKAAINNNSALVLDFKYLKSDLTRTAFLTVACVAIIAGLYIFQPQIPGLQKLISNIKI